MKVLEEVGRCILDNTPCRSQSSLVTEPEVTQILDASQGSFDGSSARACRLVLQLLVRFGVMTAIAANLLWSMEIPSDLPN